MSPSGQSFRLRPNKYVDRELFAEFVSLLVTESGPDDYVYISMGGNHLSDHLAIYRRAGLRKLYAFDWSEDVVDRQKFNAPFDNVICETHSSQDLPVLLDEIIEVFSAKQAIIWLDYTEKKRLKQLKEIEALASKLHVGDILRVTMNADFSDLKKYKPQLSPSEEKLAKGEKNAALLKRELGSYMPHSITELDYGDMAAALAKSIKRACVRGMEESPQDKEPLPILLTKYQDSTEMLTVTAVATDRSGTPKLPESWTYTPPDWDQIEMILTPELSARERLALDRVMHMEVEAIQSSLGFKLDASALKAYSKFHRFYPTFQAVID